jgi:hypothetical protein
MRFNTVCCGFAAALPFIVSTTAFAQEDPGNYTLQGSALKPSSAPANAAPYEISGTSFSGAAARTEAILTAPINADLAPYKTDSGVYLYPSMFLGFGSNDNLQRAATNAISSNFVNTAPELIAELKNKGDRYTALVSVNNTSYASSSADNYTNSEITLAGDNYFTNRARAGWSVGQVNSSDPRGSNNRPVSTEPDRWHATNLNGRMIYGAPEAPGRFELDLGKQDKTYDNNRANTAIADLSQNTMAARVFYRLGSRTLALAEFRGADIAYASSLATDSNVERRYYAGLTWEATASTTGIVKVGNMTKDFGLGGKNGYSGSSWEAVVRWLPLTYSAFDLQTTRATADASGVGDYNLNTTTTIIWNHKWSRSLSSQVSAGVLKTDFGGTTRSDSTNNFSATLDYAVLRWLKIGIDLATSDNSSNVASGAFKRNVSMVTLNASL